MDSRRGLGFSVDRTYDFSAGSLTDAQIAERAPVEHAGLYDLATNSDLLRARQSQLELRRNLVAARDSANFERSQFMAGLNRASSSTAGGGEGQSLPRLLSSSIEINGGSPGWILAQAQIPRGYNVNLLEHELGGGHTIALHVAKEIAFLRRRVNNDPDVSTASTFFSLKQATGLIDMTLNHNRTAIATMMGRPDKAWATMIATFDRPTGHSVTKGVNGFTSVSSVFILITKPAVTKEGFVIWTAFPRDP